ncbi:MAG: extensin family protein [Polyangiaceae bacterium]
MKFLGVLSALMLAMSCAAPAAQAGFGAPAVIPDRLPPAPVLGEAPAVRYSRLDRAACERELTRRGIAFTRVDEARGVLAPVRLEGALHGVTYRTGLSAAKRATSPWEIVDCRLALALDDFAAELATRGVVEVLHYSIYRPPPARWPAGRIGTRHAGGLAIDAAAFIKKDGEKLDVLRDFHGRIGAPTCGHGATPHPETPAADELRAIFCRAVAARLFNVALSPDFNWPHRNHFHLEVAVGSRGEYVR